KRIRIANGALREGVIYDLIGRIYDEDVRDRAVAELMDHYRVDKRHANHVALTASTLYHQVKQSWSITDDEDEQVLHWASQLHEIGLGIAHNQYHKHGAYLLYHMDMPGFSQGEQRRLAALVRGHRRKFPYCEFSNLRDSVRDSTLRLCILLRVAVVLHRSRPNTALSNITAHATESKLKLMLPPTWLDAHPLTVADFVQEAAWLKIADYRLTFKQEIAR
ncbi:MAG: exopolyphosphatase, partial [Gammaproteobacteria bacterium]|nr:exopolyphosphatase [Gammaproteobacteria bacterium]